MHFKKLFFKNIGVQYISISFIDTYLYTFSSLSLFSLEGLNTIGLLSSKKLGKLSKSNPTAYRDNQIKEKYDKSIAFGTYIKQAQDDDEKAVELMKVFDKISEAGIRRTIFSKYP